MKLYKIIDKAIDTKLSNGYLSVWSQKEVYSCFAVYQELQCSFVMDRYEYNDACEEFDEYVNKMGCITSEEHLFDEFYSPSDRQQARALWLTWVSMIAKEEGIEV